MAEQKYSLCQACERKRHDQCSAQVPAANAPCPCEHCWGSGGSKGFYARLDKADESRLTEDEFNSRKQLGRGGY